MSDRTVSERTVSGRTASDRTARDGIEARFAASRGRLIEKGLLPPRPRDAISDSWVRSTHLGLDPERLLPRYAGDLNDDTRLARTADIVLPRVAEELSGEPVSIILADARGNVLRRHCSDAFLLHHLDRAHLDTGFSYHEEFVGTNGIGTTLERGEATLVDGGEHFTDQLVGFSCAGAPIHHPVQGRVLGVVDLTSLAGHSSPMLLAFARSISHRMEQELLGGVSSRELALLGDYLTACRRTGGAVMAVGADLVMMNRQAQQRFDSHDRAALLARSQDAADERRPHTLVVELPSGTVVRLDYRPTFTGDLLAGGVFRISNPVADPLTASGGARPGAGRAGAGRTGGTATRRPPTGSPSRPPGRALPTLAGTSDVWQHACRSVLAQLDAGAWVVLEGESGSGKAALARAAHQLRRPAEHLRVLDPPAPDAAAEWLADLEEELDGGGGTVVLRRVDQLAADLVPAVAALVHERRDRTACEDGTWLVATVAASPRQQAVDAQLVPIFARTLAVPPLRHHLEDLGQLVDALLERSRRDQSLTMSAPALRQLARLPWPGNVDQLAGVLREIARRRRTGEIGVADLPPECLTGSRRLLSSLETMERDAIVAALIASDGNKPQAAASLGMSRATIYRKIREYGVVWQEAT